MRIYSHTLTPLNYSPSIKRFTYRYIWLIECQVEGQPECNDQQNREKKQPPKGVKDVHEHDHVDPRPRELPDEHDQSHPTKKNGNDANLPLPDGRAETVGEERDTEEEGGGEYKDLDPVDPVEEVAPHAELDRLEELDHQTNEREENDKSRYAEKYLLQKLI